MFLFITSSLVTLDLTFVPVLFCDPLIRRKKSESENEEGFDDKGYKERDVILEIDQEYKLEESLEKVYIKLLKSKRCQYII